MEICPTFGEQKSNFQKCVKHLKICESLANFKNYERMADSYFSNIFPVTVFWVLLWQNRPSRIVNKHFFKTEEVSVFRWFWVYTNYKSLRSLVVKNEKCLKTVLWNPYKTSWKEYFCIYTTEYIPPQIPVELPLFRWIYVELWSFN